VNPFAYETVVKAAAYVIEYMGRDEFMIVVQMI
jgi:hypothetical protein